VFSAAGMSLDPQKVSAVSNWTTPTTVEEVRKFIGLASYYRHYIQEFSDIAKPLHKLTQKQAQFVWSDDCHTAFNALKEKLVQAPILNLIRHHLFLCSKQMQDLLVWVLYWNKEAMSLHTQLEP